MVFLVTNLIHKQKSNNLEVISRRFAMFIDIKLSDEAEIGPHPRFLSAWRGIN